MVASLKLMRHDHDGNCTIHWSWTAPQRQQRERLKVAVSRQWARRVEESYDIGRLFSSCSNGITLELLARLRFKSGSELAFILRDSLQNS